jgi:hypothetical protein
MGIEPSCAHLGASEGVDPGDAWLWAVIASGDHVTPVTPVMRRDHTGPLIPGDIAACGLCVWSMAWWGCLVDTAGVGLVGGDGEPCQGGDGQAFCAASMPAMPASIEARGRLATVGDEPGVDSQGLVMLRGRHVHDRRLVA